MCTDGSNLAVDCNDISGVTTEELGRFPAELDELFEHRRAVILEGDAEHLQASGHLQC